MTTIPRIPREKAAEEEEELEVRHPRPFKGKRPFGTRSSKEPEEGIAYRNTGAGKNSKSQRAPGETAQRRVGRAAELEGLRCCVVDADSEGLEGTKAELRLTGTKTIMEDSEGDLSIQREAILSELCNNQITGMNLVQDMKTLVALNDPEDRILFQTPDGVKQPGELENSKV